MNALLANVDGMALATNAGADPALAEIEPETGK
jgi:hypothetical protein